MTPLAQKIVKQLCLPVKQRVEGFDSKLANDILRAQCFEVSAVMDTLTLFKVAGELVDGKYPFNKLRASVLPAELTWVEWDSSVRADGNKGDRFGLLFSGNWPFFVQACRWKSRALNFTGSLRRPLKEVDPICQSYALISLINTPATFGRKTHQPHTGLQRDLAKQFKMVGTYPLNAWTEITIEMGELKDLSTAKTGVGRLGCRQPLHFVRTFERQLPHKKVMVKGHYRGDPSIGIRRSRYNLTNRRDISLENLLPSIACPEKERAHARGGQSMGLQL